MYVGSNPTSPIPPGVAEMVDASDLGSGLSTKGVGSNPTIRKEGP